MKKLTKRKILQMDGFNEVWSKLSAKEKNRWCRENLSNKMRADFNQFYMNYNKGKITEKGSKTMKYFNVRLETEKEQEERIKETSKRIVRAMFSSPPQTKVRGFRGEVS